MGLRNLMDSRLLEIDLTINHKWPGEKLGLQDRRFGVFNGTKYTDLQAIRFCARE